VTGLLAGVYTSLVLLAARILPLHDPMAMATATLAAAGLFNLLAHGSSKRRIASSTGLITTRSRPWPRSRPGSKTPSTSARPGTTWPGTVHQAPEPAHLPV
jgi:hypothetical protein